MNSPIRSSLSMTLIALSLQACVYNTPAADDAGDDAWVTDVVPMLTGRNPKGYTELKALSRLTRDVGREEVAQTLMHSEDYVDYWTEVFIDILRVERSGGYTQNAGCYENSNVPKAFADELVNHLLFDDPRDGADDWCHKTSWTTPGAPLQLDGSRASGGASSTEGYVSQPPLTEAEEAETQAYLTSCPTFTMRDVIRAALWTDNLSVIWPAQVIPLGASGNTTQDNNRQSNLRNRFVTAYLDRDDECIGCHSTTFSVTGNLDAGWSDWERHVPAAGYFGNLLTPHRIDLEGTAFSIRNASGGMLYGGDGSRWSTMKGFFQAPQLGSSAAPGIDPWGMDDACSTLTGNADFRGYNTSFTPSSTGGAIAMQQLDPQSSVFTLIDMFQETTWDLRGHANLGSLPTGESPDQTSTHATANLTDGADILASCEGSCHYQGGSSPAAPDLKNVVRSINWRTLAALLEGGSGSMPSLESVAYVLPADLQSRTATQVARDLSAYVKTNNLGTDRGHDFLETPSHAVSLLNASATINRVVTEVVGGPLVLEHGQSRHMDQAMQLAALTEQLISSDWSLRTILTTVATSNWVGRRTPMLATSSTDYPLPQAVNPWSMADPTATAATGDDANSVGDLVHERSVAQRGHMLHVALGWPDVLAFGGEATETWPDADLMADMGRHSTDTQVERPLAALDTILAWDELVGACAKPTSVLAGSVTPVSSAHADTDIIDDDQWTDFIDHTIDEAQATTTSLFTGSPTVKEMFQAVRDRILADGRMSSDEEAAVSALLEDQADWTRQVGLGFTFSGTSLSRKAGNPSQFESALRTYCGALLTSPQFMLGGMNTRTSYSWLAQHWTACGDGEPCSGDEWCDEWGEDMRDLGYDVPETSCSSVR